MLSYIAKRLLQAVGVVFAVVTAVFVAVRSIPGDPARVMAGNDADPETLRAIRAELGLDEPLHVQYIGWVTDIVQGDLGTSIVTKEPVLERLVSTAEPTISIGVFAMVIALVIAIPTGIVSAVRKDTVSDHVATILSFTAISMPSFWIGIVLLFAFVRLDLLPSFGYTSISEGIVPWLKHIILPASAVGIPYGGIMMRMVRSSMLEVINEDYMRTARAKGLDPRIVLFKHGLQNALIPVVTIAGLFFGMLLTGTVAVEIVFGIQGLGRVLINSIKSLDFPVVQGAVIIVSIVFVLTNLAVDILYTAINPRIKYGSER